jgi:hypothetical protein
MKVSSRFSARLIAVALLCFGPYAFAQGSAGITVTSPGNNVMNGVYVGPYNATVNGVSTQVICDDFPDETYPNESWTANVTTISNLSGTKWGNNKALYDEAAYFAVQMMGLESSPQQNAQTIGYLSYVIWSLFDASDVKNWLYSQGQQGINTWKAIQSYLASAGNYANFTPPANFFIWTPNTGDPITCSGGPCPTPGPPQEFIGFFSVPEGGSALLYLLFAGLACGFGVLLRSRPPAVRGSI